MRQSELRVGDTVNYFGGVSVTTGASEPSPMSRAADGYAEQFGQHLGGQCRGMLFSHSFYPGQESDYHIATYEADPA